MKSFLPQLHVSRRNILQAGGMGMLGFGLSQLRALGSPQTGLGKAKSVILIFNGGAPSHIDLWDPKPDAPSEIRGEFKTIKTNGDDHEFLDVQTACSVGPTVDQVHQRYRQYAGLGPTQIAPQRQAVLVGTRASTSQ